MEITEQIARHFRELYFGGNFTGSCLQEQLSDVNWEMATTQKYGLNTIAVLVFHIQYYIRAVTNVLEGGTVDAHDKYSFDLPPLHNEDEWEKLKSNTWDEAIKFENLVKQLPVNKLGKNFGDGKYGTYYRNIAGVIEHSHYHLGQIALLKKIILAEAADNL